MVCLYVFPKGRLKNSILEEEAPICRSMKLYGELTTSLLLVPTTQLSQALSQLHPLFHQCILLTAFSALCLLADLLGQRYC